jgi:cardiolipin synthase
MAPRPFVWIDALRPAFTLGNRVVLQRSGAEYFPALRAAIDGAREDIFIETYIFWDDDTGRSVAQALAAAARRGVGVHVVIDGFGTGRLAPALDRILREAGVLIRIYGAAQWWDLTLGRLRRMHRKIAVIDGRIAFVGGINLLDDVNDPLAGRLELPRLDFAVRIEGPLVAAIEHAARRMWTMLDLRSEGVRTAWQDWVAGRTVPASLPDGVEAAFVKRDNLRNRRTIEVAYLAAIGHARSEILICNAYFVPSKRFRSALAKAAERGVRVRLLLQGRSDHPLQQYATRAMYEELLAHGVEIREYTRSVLHAKVAVIDGHWSTVGSSNLDPFSLLLAREANVVVRDPGFASTLSKALEENLETAAVMRAVDSRPRTLPMRMLHALSYVLLRILVMLSGAARKY